MANTLTTIQRQMLEVSCLSSMSPEYIVGEIGPELFIPGIPVHIKRRDPEILHDGDWFIARATRDAKRATLGFALLLVAIAAIILFAKVA